MKSANKVINYFNYLFGLLIIGLSIQFGEFYPFTVNPMFSDVVDVFVLYELKDANGNNIDVRLVGLNQVYDGNPIGLGAGLKPLSYNHYGKILEESDLVQIIRNSESIDENKFSYPIEVNQKIYGPFTDGTKYGLMETRKILVFSAL